MRQFVKFLTILMAIILLLSPTAASAQTLDGAEPPSPGQGEPADGSRQTANDRSGENSSPSGTVQEKTENTGDETAREPSAPPSPVTGADVVGPIDSRPDHTGPLPVENAAGSGSEAPLSVPQDAPATTENETDIPGQAAPGTGSGEAAGSTRGKIVGINEARWYDSQQLMQEVAYSASSSRGLSLTDLSVSAGTELRFYLDADMFVDEQGNPIGTRNESFTLAELRKSRVAVRVVGSQNSSLIDAVSLDYDKASGKSFIKVAFVNPFAGAGRRSFALKLSLSINGTVQSATRFELEGKIGNQEVKLNAGDEYVELSPNMYFTANDYIRNMKLDIGEGVVLTANLFPNKKYYAAAAVTPDAADPNNRVVMTYRLFAANIPSNASCSIHLAEPYYIYDANGAYLGATGETLPFSRTYYLAEEKVEELGLEDSGSHDGRER